jgi:hypothetical protein
MASDFFEQLAQSEVPPPPPEFNRQLHQRVNRSLLLVHLADLAVGAVPWAMVQMARALIGLVSLTITGKFDAGSKKKM